MSDAARALTPQGVARFRRVVTGLQRLGVTLDRVYHSPKLRAARTAALLAPIARGESSATLNLSRTPARPLLAELRGERVALVGHEPWLGMLAAWLVTGDRARGARFPLKKGGVIVLDGTLRAGAMRLVAALPPRTLRRVGRR